MNGSTPPERGQTGAGATLDQRLRRTLRRARLALAWEGVWAALWPTQAIVGLFLAFALFDLPHHLGGWGHAVALAAFAVALMAGLAGALRRFRWPVSRDAERRLEGASGLKHRPLATLSDRPAAAGEEGRALWVLHQRRLAATLGGLRVGAPRSRLPGIDPRAWRAAVLLVVVAGLGVAGERSGERIAGAFVPVLHAAAPLPSTVDLWIEPPDYTGLPPVYARRDQAELRFPAGSRLSARVGGGTGRPNLLVDGEERPFEEAGAQAYAIETAIDAGGRLEVRQDGAALVEWAIEVVQDDPPTVTLVRPPSITQRQALRIDYHATDDYGVVGLSAELRRVVDGATVTDEAPLELPVPAPGPRAREAQGSTYADLTAHAWAGAEVEIRVAAVDGAGQRGESEAARILLPERVFTHPVARLIVETRKRLAQDRQARNDVARRLDAIARMGEMFDDDVVVHLGLSAAKWRLRRDLAPATVDAVRDLLWDTALRLEDGDMTLAERELRDAQQALMDALNRDAPQAEIDRALERLWAAIQKFLHSMMASADEQQPLTPEQMREMQSVDAQDLREMLQRMRELSESGSRDAAKDMLSQLQEMLENLRAAQAMGQEDRQAMQQMMDMMRELQGMTQQQRDLLDRTFRDAQQQGQTPGQQMPGQQMPGRRMPGQQPGQMPGQQPGQPGESGLPGEQEQLRRMLGDLMRRLGEQSGQIPNAFGRAERAMRDAVGSLEGGEPGEAVGSQSEALDQLQQAGRSMMEEMARQMGVGDPGGQQAGETDPRFDPLGRPPGGRGVDSRDVVIPAESDVQRARDIRDELYRRSGDRARPRFELDYIERLLERF